MEEEMSNAEEQLISNTINAVNNSLEDGFCHPFFQIIGIALWLKTFYEQRLLFCFPKKITSILFETPTTIFFEFSATKKVY
ncbi:hypothetical protein B0E34_13355 [Chryseobacterium mucoviscidosis]|uniref:Uncharacterized protein n=1 Tax=Chryseobacterium mucoviscidosis TaxID=1945581 RepID=A0A202BYE0_9FLAO|nr:hypothetical protein B0E34_13355 [Chryseobacterium mucoviscidosis]